MAKSGRRRLQNLNWFWLKCDQVVCTSMAGWRLCFQMNVFLKAREKLPALSRSSKPISCSQKTKTYTNRNPVSCIWILKRLTFILNSSRTRLINNLLRTGKKKKKIAINSSKIIFQKIKPGLRILSWHIFFCFSFFPLWKPKTIAKDYNLSDNKNRGGWPCLLTFKDKLL